MSAGANRQSRQTYSQTYRLPLHVAVAFCGRLCGCAVRTAPVSRPASIHRPGPGCLARPDSGSSAAAQGVGTR
jgi:hypothetical protein